MQFKWEFKDSKMNFNVCSVSSYKANVKNLQREGVGGLWTVDNGFSPPGYLNMGKMMKPLWQEAAMITAGKDGVFSPFCSQLVWDGLLLNLQVHGDQNSIKQNITYNPVQYLFPLFCFPSQQLLVLIGLFWRHMRHFRNADYRKTVWSLPKK